MPRNTKSAPKGSKQTKTEERTSTVASDHKNDPIAQGEVLKTPAKYPSENIPVGSSNKRKRSATMAWPWTHERPTPKEAAEHVRTSGRNLVPWQRPRMAEKLLLFLEFECNRQGINVPWDDIAHRFHPGATGAGMLQHFARLRSIMAAEGHLIPPKLPTKKDRTPLDSTIRGYIRRTINPNGEVVVRTIKYTEPLEHSTFSKADAHDCGAYALSDPDDDEDAPLHKLRKLEALIDQRDGFTSVSKRQRRTRVPIKYEDATESEVGSSNSKSAFEEVQDGEEQDAGELFVGSENDDQVPLGEEAIRDDVDVDVEARARRIYIDNMVPKVPGQNTVPMYLCHGKLMTFKQVCAKAIELHGIFGYQDPECGRIIATHECDGHIPAMGYGGAMSMAPAQNNIAAGINNNMVFTQTGPVTPTKSPQGNPILFGPFNNSGGMIGSGHGFNTDSSSPTPFGMGGNMTSPLNCKSSNAYTTPPDFNDPIEYSKKAMDDFHTHLFDKGVGHTGHAHLGVGNTGGGMGSGAGKTKAFDAAAYSHQVLAGPVTAHAGQSSGSSMGTGNVANMPNDVFAGNIWNGNSGNAGSGADLGSSAMTKDLTVAQDTPTASQTSTSDLKQAEEPVVDDHNDLHFDAQFDSFLDFPGDGSDNEEAAFPN